ncbi:L,D-transpeptidase family protein [Mucilaginibacter myungsuensis]|uniref:L,D-transpeptidase family protein n=1 Tax=Mucilaginibacter myungsuensis TaxID=649104 RepID=A0A929L430_9SPHI|nr:L,D-transpeptidase family protein [Mucilaginibacter myungsuensis]MBE9664109.1 L,D-transpeptidase family protein [Mucilaginibacter myungsuensis]MDN3601288.1 L,D-transpeptidase family protein [Mucilaginibacter myungsuensis]
MKRPLLLVIIFIAILASCKQPAKKKAVKVNPKKTWDKTIQGNFSATSELKVDTPLIDTFFKQYPDLASSAELVKDFYRNRKQAYAWFSKGKLIEQAGNLSNRVMDLQNEGIYKTTPYQKALDSLIHGNQKKKADLNLELMLTAQYFSFAKMVYGGMDASVSKATKWYVPRKKLAYAELLDSLIKAPTSAAEPVYRQYELLKIALGKYRKLEALNDWPTITSGDTLAISKRLTHLGDLKANTSANISADTLKAAIKQFQGRHGLATNGKAGKETLAALNVPLKTRIIQLMVNMERSRWLPVSIKTDYLAVNIPEFKLHVYHADSLLWSTRVVVGQTTHPTTVFFGEVKYVVFSPYWNVPESIVRNEVLPGIRRNPNYIAAHRMEITGKENGLPVIRQKPGESNSLGLVKFLFPNSYNIYLHDTPSKSLFGESARAFSHGCIRVSEPAKLARFLLRNDAKWDSVKIDKAMHRGNEQYVTLKDKVPVFLAYFTSFIDRDGLLNFRKDIYNLDGKLAETLISGSGSY